MLKLKCQRGNRAGGWRLEVGGGRLRAKCQMLNVKVQNSCEGGKTTSERESYFFDKPSQATSGEKPSSGLKAA
jgi:hypothetical protein